MCFQHFFEFFQRTSRRGYAPPLRGVKFAVSARPERAPSSRTPPMAVPQRVHARAEHAEHALDLMVHALREHHTRAARTVRLAARRGAAAAVRERHARRKTSRHLRRHGRVRSPRRFLARGGAARGYHGRARRHPSAAQSPCWSCRAVRQGNSYCGDRPSHEVHHSHVVFCRATLTHARGLVQHDVHVLQDERLPFNVTAAPAGT